MADSIENNDALLFIENVHKHNIENDTGFLLSQLPLRNSLNILDVGYGTGNLLLKIKNTQYDINAYGVEKSRVLYEHSKEILLKSKVNICCLDFEHWSENVKFDIIVMAFFLHHVDCFSDYLKKAFSLLNSQGMLVIMDRIALDYDSKLEFKSYWEKHYAATHEWREECPSIFTRAELQKIVEDNDLYLSEFILVPHDARHGAEKFPKTVAFIKREM